VLESIHGRYIDKKASWDLLTDEISLCFQATLLSFAIFASDKSAFCEVQISIYNRYAFYTKKRNWVTPSPVEGKALLHVNMVLD
jgi:hypothetical protein